MKKKHLTDRVLALTLMYWPNTANCISQVSAALGTTRSRLRILLLRALIPVLQGNNGYAGSYEQINPANDRVFALGNRLCEI